MSICFRCGPIYCKFFMSDDAIQFWNSWKTVFHQDNAHFPKKLLCIWHVQRNWKSQMIKLHDNSLEQRAAVWRCLLVRLKERDNATFQRNLTKFLTELDESGEREFLDYFQRYYCHLDRIKEWAYWARQGSPVNVNMFLESFHNTLKDKFLQRKENRRLDAFVSTLLEVAKYYLQEYAIASIRGGPKNSFRQTEMHRRHRSALAMDASHVVPVRENVWTVMSASRPDNRYVVQRVKDKCDCRLICTYVNCNVLPGPLRL